MRTSLSASRFRKTSATVRFASPTLAPVRNPRVIANGRREWFRTPDILAEIIRPGCKVSERPGRAEVVHTLGIHLRPGESLSRHHVNWGDDVLMPALHNCQSDAPPFQMAHRPICAVNPPRNAASSPRSRLRHVRSPQDPAGPFLCAAGVAAERRPRPAFPHP